MPELNGFRHAAFAIVLSLACCTATPAHAQPTQGVIVSGEISAFALDSNTDLSFSLFAGYRFNRVFGLGVEVTAVPSLSPASSSPYWPLRALPFRAPQFADGQATVFTSNVRLEIPTISDRVIPYLVAGGGVANVKESVDAIILPAYLAEVFSVSSSAVPPSLAPTLPTIFPPPYIEPYVLSATDLALTIGGGASITAGEHLSVDVDLRYVRIVGATDRNVGRFGAGASYRF
jgi:opacity protein-like surface antigen